MTQEVQITLKVEDLKDEVGNSLIFEIPFNQLIRVIIKSIHAMASDFKSPIRLYASNVFTALMLLVDVLDNDDVKAPEKGKNKILKEGEKERIIGEWETKWRGEKKLRKVAKKKAKRKKRVVGMRPSTAQLLKLRNNGTSNREVAELLGVSTSTVWKWYNTI
jgi:hypothetical protein